MSRPNGGKGGNKHAGKASKKAKVTQKKPDPSPRKMSRLKKMGAAVAGGAAFIVAAITIFDRVTKQSPPNLAVTFFESGSDRLSLVPPIDTGAKMSEEIPLALKIENRGSTASANTKLYLSHGPSLQLAAEYQKESKNMWIVPNEPMEQLTVKLESINPGESYLVPIKVRFHMSAEFQDAISRPPSRTKGADPVPLGFSIYSEVSSESVKPNKAELLLLLGRCDILLERSPTVFWVGHSDEGVKVLQVKDDYPCKE